MKVVDFPFVYKLVDALSFGKDIYDHLILTHFFDHNLNIRSATQTPIPSQDAICVADCHDSVLGDAYKFSGIIPPVQ